METGNPNILDVSRPPRRLTYRVAMGDQERLRGYVEVWWQAVNDLIRLLEKIPADQWSTPTDLDGWNVHAIAAHIAHLEAVMSGADHDDVEIGQPAHVHGMMGTFTEQGVVARRGRSADSLIREIRESATRRHTQLLASPPADPTATADGFAAFIGWSWKTLLRNRPLDVWMHEQDIRRAIGVPGNMDGVVAQHAADYLIESLPVGVGKRVSPPAGTTVLLAVEGSQPYAVSVGEDARAHPMAVLPHNPTVRLGLSREDFIVLAGGRRDPAEVDVEGDETMAELILDAFAVTP
jgi:uncharacterized protein (TIGR03083 family)